MNSKNQNPAQKITGLDGLIEFDEMEEHLSISKREIEESFKKIFSENEKDKSIKLFHTKNYPSMTAKIKEMVKFVYNCQNGDPLRFAAIKEIAIGGFSKLTPENLEKFSSQRLCEIIGISSRRKEKEKYSENDLRTMLVEEQKKFKEELSTGPFEGITNPQMAILC